MTGKSCVWEFPERGCRVYVPLRVLALLRKMARTGYPNETGGTLVGCYSDDRRVAYVRAALGVRRGARRGRRTFYRPPDSVDGQLSELYAEWEGKVHYLGEWHSHPGDSARVSPTDRRTMTELARTRQVATDTPIIVIVAGELERCAEFACCMVLPSGEVIYGQPVDARADPE